ncbi:MAG TPA: hypothetical protein DEH78_16730, partial [Solibacterales bacterium]|nr:hypothetical protein [Bryobacterales bacterium]
MPIPPRLGAAAILMAAMATASAADFGALKPQGFLSDFANVADAESRQRLERYGEQLRKATGSQIAIVTLPTVQGEPIEDVA